MGRHTPTVVSERAPSSRAKKLIIRSFLVGISVIACWIAVLVVWQSASTEAYGFRSETTEILKLLTKGQAAQVYDQSSALFRREATREHFIDLTGELNQVLGPFQKIITTVPGKTSNTKRGKTGHATSRLRFKHGATTGEFSYHHIDGKWRLLGFNIALPANHKNKPITTKPALTETLDTRARAIFEKIRDGKMSEVYKSASEPFQLALKEERFLQVVALHKKRLGQLEKIIGLSLAYQDKWKTHAEIVAVLKYKRVKGGTTATLQFLNVENDWKLLAYHVSMSATPTKLSK